MLRRMLARFTTLITLFAIVIISRPAGGQPRFGVEVAAGQNVGVTSYVDNVVVLQGDLPLLADELPGTGAAFTLDFIFSNWSVGAEARLFDRDTIRLHHRGLETLPPNRVRPDGSVDDSGVEYVELAPVRSPSPVTQPGDLLLIDVGAAYRFYVVDGRFALWFPLGASVLAAKVLEPALPTVLGLGAEVGVGAAYEVASPIGIYTQAQLRGVLTPAYRPLADASRGSFVAGESTEEAVFSSMGYGSFVVGLQITIR